MRKSLVVIESRSCVGSVRSFVIEYEDGGGNDWTLTLAESTWQ